MYQKSFLPIFGFLFWVLFCPVCCSSAVVAPQDFTDEVYSCCANNDLDRFLGWLQIPGRLEMNGTFKKTRPITLPSTMPASDRVYYGVWKEEYYGKFGDVSQTKPFLLAGEFYPTIHLLQSTALSFYELSPVVRTCVMISGKLGNPIAKNILVLEGIEGGDSELTELLSKADFHDDFLLDLLRTPFVWNNIRAMDFLKDPSRSGRIFGFMGGINPFVYLNGYFVATELNLDPTASIPWLNEAMRLGSALAAIRLHRMRMPIDDTLPTVKGSLAVERAHNNRYGIGGAVNRLQARAYYEEALGYTSLDPFLHMEIAEFYKDLYMADAFGEVGMEESEIMGRILCHYKRAHIRGDGEAAPETIKFISYLQRKGTVFLPGFFGDWELPHDDILEALTKLYEIAYLRIENPLFLDRIKKMDKRTSGDIDTLTLRAIRNVAFRSSLIRFGV